MVMDTPQSVLDFWFGDTNAPRREWFVKDPAFDAAIELRFGPLVARAQAGRLAHWQDTPEGALAVILLVDQFARNIHRGDPRAFAGDPVGLAAARALVASGDDRKLPPVRRAFVYLPFEHAEDLACQDEALRLFGTLAAEAPQLADMLDYARRHRDVIARFGRFPHRNAVLGRPSTAEEEVFLTQPGSAF